ENEVVRFLLLQHQPHADDEVARVAPIALGVKIAEIKLFLKSPLDGSNRARDLARHKGFPSQRTLMVEKYAVGGMQAIRLPIVDGNPVGVELGDAVRRARLERGRLALGHFA